MKNNEQIAYILTELVHGNIPIHIAEEAIRHEIERITSKNNIGAPPINLADWKNDFSTLAEKLELPLNNKKAEEVEGFVLSVINTATTREKQLTAKLIEEKGNQIKNKLYQELDKILPWLYDYLEEVEVKLKKDGSLEYTTGFNEGRYTTVKQFKNTLTNMWNEMKARFKKNKPQDQETPLYEKMYEEMEAIPWNQEAGWRQVGVNVTSGTIIPRDSLQQGRALRPPSTDASF